MVSEYWVCRIFRNIPLSNLGDMVVADPIIPIAKERSYLDTVHECLSGWLATYWGTSRQAKVNFGKE